MEILSVDFQSKEKMLQTLKEGLNEGYTHFIPSDLSIEIYPDQMAAIKSIDSQESIAVDYTIDGYYQNDSRYFGEDYLTFDYWMNNINHFPNIIFSITQSIEILNRYECQTAFDLTVWLLLFEKVALNSHVVFDFKQQSKTSASLYQAIKANTLSSVTQFNINKLAYLHHHKLPFKNRYCEMPNHPRMLDQLLFKTHFKMPHFISNQILKRSEIKHQNISNIYEKVQLHPNGSIVFLGFDYGFRGNSRYLFNYLAKYYSQYPIYYVTSDAHGPHFIKPDDPEAQHLIENADVVITESYIPDAIKPNGTVIQLWHGTPLKQLFLDSKESYQKQEVYNYRARKYNKWLQQNYLICDSQKAAELFKTAFPMQYSEIVACGYPRVRYLLEKKKDLPYVQFIKKELQLDPNKPTLLYAPTWKTNSREDDRLPFTKALLDHYNVIFKGHIESTEDIETDIPKAVIQPSAHIETQDLILASDIVISDYSSIVFDALTIDMPVALYAPHEAAYEEERGLYANVWRTFEKVRYQNADQLISDLINHNIELISNPYVNRNNHSFETISSLIIQHMSSASKKPKTFK